MNSMPARRTVNPFAYALCALLSALTTLSAPALADDTVALLRVPINVTVTPPAGSNPIVTGDFVFNVACNGSSESRFGFFTPAVSLTANQLPAPFATPLGGSVVSSNASSSTSGCTVTQIEEPAPPSGYFWANRPLPAITGPIDVINGGGTVTAPTLLFENRLVAGLPISFDIVPPGGGTVACDVNPVPPGTAARCNVTPAPGFRLQNSSAAVTGCDGEFQGSYYTGLLDHACTITANFTQYQFVVSTIAAPTQGGVVACSLPASLNATSTCDITLYPGYLLSRVTGCGVNVTGNAAQFVTAPVTANCSVLAEFSALPVPTLDEWAQRLMAVLLAIAACVVIRRSVARR
jgi:hypothetical protein